MNMTSEMIGSSTLRKVLEKVKDQIDFPPTLELIIHRTYAGRVQRQNGAWAWFAVDPETGQELVGSQWRLKDLAKEPSLIATREFDASGYSIDPDRDLTNH